MKLFTGSGFESEDRGGSEVTTDRRADYCEDMSHSTDESSDTMLQKDQIDSPSLDEDSSGGSSNGRRGLKKGPWTTFEDAILVDYVKKHGEGNWNAVQKNTGLARCGKSCRLRWANHLKPNLKKGAFTTEEEKLIIELHARMGNKWSRMAAHLPGRTDNEIKNYWNTRIKRCKRAGLPLYPSNISFQVSNANYRNRAGGRFTSSNRKLNELLQENTQEAPTILFDYFKVDTLAPSYAPPSPKIPVSTVLNKRFGSQDIGSMDPIAKVADNINEGSESLFPGFQRVCNDPFEKFRGYFGLGGYPGGHTLSNGNISASKTLNGLEKSELPSLQYQEALSNGDISVSKPFNGSEKSELPSLQYQETGLSNGHISASKPLNGSEKSELPSLQYQESDLCSWLAWSYAPFDEAVDMCVEYQTERSEEMDSVSPINSGLLEALIHEAQRLCGTKNDTSEMSLSSPPVIPGCKVEISTVLSLEERLWEKYDDPISPLGCSDASLFSNCSPTISGSSSDEFPPFVIQTGMNFGQATAASIF